MAVGQLASQYGVAWARCMWGVGVGFSLSVPSLASVSAISFPMMPVWARTFGCVIVCGVQYIWCIMAAMSSLSGWWCCEVGCCMWLLIRYILLRLSVNMCVSIWVVCMVLTAMSIAFSSALRMFWYPGNLSDIWVLLLGLYIPDPAVLPFIWPSEFSEGGMNDPSVYMHCCGWYLRGYWW